MKGRKKLLGRQNHKRKKGEKQFLKLVERTKARTGRNEVGGRSNSGQDGRRPTEKVYASPPKNRGIDFGGKLMGGSSKTPNRLKNAEKGLKGRRLGGENLSPGRGSLGAKERGEGRAKENQTWEQNPSWAGQKKNQEKPRVTSALG